LVFLVGDTSSDVHNGSLCELLYLFAARILRDEPKRGEYFQGENLLFLRKILGPNDQRVVGCDVRNKRACNTFARLGGMNDARPSTINAGVGNDVVGCCGK